MSVNRLEESPWRPGENLLLWAFVASLAAHVVLYGTYAAGHRFGWWKKDLMPAWLKTTSQVIAEAKLREQNQPPVQREIPLVFVEVDPATATPEPPKNATHYSSRNSHADNTDATLESLVPKIDGSQTHVAKTQSAPKSKPTPLQPTPPKSAQPEVTAEAKPKPKGGQPVGDLALNKPSLNPGEGQAEQDPGQSETPVHKRPTTLAEAKFEKAIAGEKMKQDGGVKPRLRLDSLDTIGTPFGEYDAELIRAIQSRWDDLLDSKQFSRDRSGKVVVAFTLNPDGSITGLQIIESNVGDFLSSVCELAIRDPSPFARWPPDMLRLFGSKPRDVQFTFYYE